MLPTPVILADRRALAKAPGKQEEIVALCKDLWGLKQAPPHWSGMRWKEIAEHIGPEMAERNIQWFSLYAWHVHGGGAGVGGLDAESFRGIELMCRQEVREVACDTFHLFAKALHAYKVRPDLAARIAFARDEAETAALIDERLISLGRPTKLARRS